MNATLEAIARREGDGWIVAAPRVGVFRGAPRPGGHRGGGDTVGTLEVAGRVVTIVLPDGVDGLVTGCRLDDRSVPVEYGQPLFTIAPIASGAAAAAVTPAGRASTDAGAGDDPLPEGAHAVVSPLDGVFYRSPSPGAPPFVTAGDAVAEGKTLGLVEAMKSFNAVTYGGAGLPPRATLVEIRAEDGSEVRRGARLFVVRAVPDA